MSAGTMVKVSGMGGIKAQAGSAGKSLSVSKT
jgi:hypothetical protein